MDLLAAYADSRCVQRRVWAPRSCTSPSCLQTARSSSHLLPLACSGDEGAGEPVKLLSLSVSAAPDVEVAGLQLVKNQAVPVGQALHLQRESLPLPPLLPARRLRHSPSQSTGCRQSSCSLAAVCSCLPDTAAGTEAYPSPHLPVLCAAASSRLVMYNLPVEQMHAPVVGPLHHNQKDLTSAGAPRCRPRWLPLAAAAAAAICHCLCRCLVQRPQCHGACIAASPPCHRSSAYAFLPTASASGPATAGLRNHRAGHVEDANMNSYSFDEQYNTFDRWVGAVQRGAGSWLGIWLAGRLGDWVLLGYAAGSTCPVVGCSKKVFAAGGVPQHCPPPHPPHLPSAPRLQRGCGGQPLWRRPGEAPRLGGIWQGIFPH